MSPFVEIECLPASSQHDRGQVRADLADEVILDILALFGVQVGFGNDANAAPLQFANQRIVGLEKYGLVAEDLALDVGQQDGRVPLERPFSIRADFLDALQRGYPHPVVLVLIARENSQETKPLKQRDGLVPCLLKDPAVEGDLRQLTRDDRAGSVSVVAGHELSDARNGFRAVVLNRLAVHGPNRPSTESGEAPG